MFFSLIVRLFTNKLEYYFLSCFWYPVVVLHKVMKSGNLSVQVL